MAETLDRAALAKLRRLHEEATPGPWRQVGGMVAFGPLDARESGANPALIVEMRNALPSLLALAERVAAIDPALLDRLAARYTAGWTDSGSLAGDADVLALVAAIRGEAVPDAN